MFSWLVLTLLWALGLNTAAGSKKNDAAFAFGLHFPVKESRIRSETVCWGNSPSREPIALIDTPEAPPAFEAEVKTSATNSSSLESLLTKVKSYLSDKDQKLVTRAYIFSKEVHDEAQHLVDDKSSNTHNLQQRSWIHAVGVAHILADLQLDVASIVTGLLHSTILEEHEDDGIALQQMEDNFGLEIRQLVEGVVQISKITRYRSNSSHPQEHHQAENYRKMLLTMAPDIRVILVKLAQQTQATRMFEYEASSDQQKIVAQETLDLYTPLAHRLGMYSLKTELEDTCLRFWKPNIYQQLQAMVTAQQEQRQIYTAKVINVLKRCMADAGLKSAGITGRPKSFYSIFKKMQTKNVAFDDIQDLMAFRILVDGVGQCYQALGVVHAHWKPVPGRFKDYIAVPKPNGYQSLHTTVVGPEGKRMEVQIRTHEMHQIAEGGIAAHWIYKGGPKKTQEAQRYKWLRQLVEWVKINESKEIDMDPVFEREVFVFSPRGQLFALPKGSSILDFAYRVHSEVGNHCVGAKVNGRMVPLKYKVKNGDTVDILQSSSQTPHQEWLNIAQTSKAQARIRSWLKKKQIGDESIALGQELLEKGLKKYALKHPNTDVNREYKEKRDHVLSALKLDDERHLFTALAYGQISLQSILNEIFNVSAHSSRGLSLDEKGDELVLKSIRESASSQPLKSDGVVVGGKRNMLISFCRNCNPLYGEEVKGVVTQGRGWKVHRLDCKYLLESDIERRVDAVWDEDSKARSRATYVQVIFEDAPGMLASMSKAISCTGVNIGGVVLKTISKGRGLVRFELMLSSIEDLRKVMDQLIQEPGVLSVERR